MNPRDDLLRAAVYAAGEAYDAGDPEAFTVACRRVVFVHRAWPLIAAEWAILRAEEALAARKARTELVRRAIAESYLPAKQAAAA